MRFTEAVKRVFSKYADFSGRACRSELWYFYLFYAIVITVLSILSTATGGADSPGNIFTVISELFSLATLVPSLAVGCRRLHDIGRSGWFQLIALIPLVGGILLLVRFCEDTHPGANQYGPDPREEAAQQSFGQGF